MTRSSDAPLRVTFLLSGSGRTLENLAQRIEAETIPARIVRVISSRGDVPGVERAKRLHIPVTVVERRRLSFEDFQKQLTDAVRRSEADLACMGGFLSLWEIPDDYMGRVINIHPALLPDFGGKGMHGLAVHEAVLSAKRRQSGCTVHFCDNHYDRGPIILQRQIDIPADCTPRRLANLVFEQECIAYPQAVEWFAQGRITLHHDHFIAMRGMGP